MSEIVDRVADGPSDVFSNEKDYVIQVRDTTGTLVARYWLYGCPAILTHHQERRSMDTPSGYIELCRVADEHIKLSEVKHVGGSSQGSGGQDGSAERRDGERVARGEGSGG